MQQRVVVVLPTYNEAENIVAMLSALTSVRAELADHDLHVLVVDDNSPDGTSDIVKDFQEKRPFIHLLNGKKEGLGRAYVRGFRHALRRLKAEIVIQMDADFSHDPLRIPQLVAGIDNGADYVIGSRYVAKGTIPGDWPLTRILMSRVANFVSHKVGGLNEDVADTTGGYKAIRAAALKKVDLDAVGASGYVFQVVLLQSFMEAGFTIKEVPINFVDRTAGQSKVRTADIVEFFKVSYGLNPHSPFRQLLRFMLVGASGIIVNLVVLYLFNQTKLFPVIVSSMIATEASVLNNFLLNNFFTFKQQSFSTPKELLRGLATYHLAVAAGFALTISTFALLHTNAGVHYLVAQLAGVVLSFMANYWISRKYVWSKARVTA